MMQVICLCVSLTFNAIRHFLNMNNKNMDIKDLTWNEISSRRFNNPLFPKSIRGILVGKSACGKTTLLLNFLLRPGWLDYNNLYVFGKSLFQPEYRILKKSLPGTTTQEIDTQVIRQPKRDNAVEPFTGYPPRRNG